jgi:hypothetical protein
MKDGKAEILDVKLEAGMILRVTAADRESRDIYIRLTRALAAPGTTFEIVSDTVVRCIPPGARAC